MKEEDIFSCDPEVMSGEPVFAGTRVEVRTFVDHLKAGYSVDDFLEGFPSVSREQVAGYLEMTLQTSFGKPDARAVR